MEIEAMINGMSQFGGALAGLAAILAGLKAVVDVFRAKKSQPDNVVEQRRLISEHGFRHAPGGDHGEPARRVTSAKLIVRVVVMWVAMALIVGGAIAYEESVGLLSDTPVFILLGVLGLLLLLSLVYLFRLLYRCVVYVFVH